MTMFIDPSEWPSVRAATLEDMPLVYEMMQELAVEENYPDLMDITLEELIRSTGFSDPTKPPESFCAVGDIKSRHENDENKMVTVGYYRCYYSYSMWKGKTLFMEDIFVQKDYRRSGVALSLFNHFMKRSQRASCRWFAMHLKINNPNIAFFKKFNLTNFTERSGQQILRLEEHAIDQLLHETERELPDGVLLPSIVFPMEQEDVPPNILPGGDGAGSSHIRPGEDEDEDGAGPSKIRRGGDGTGPPKRLPGGDEAGPAV